MPLTKFESANILEQRAVLFMDRTGINRTEYVFLRALISIENQCLCGYVSQEDIGAYLGKLCGRGKPYSVRQVRNIQNSLFKKGLIDVQIPNLVDRRRTGKTNKYRVICRPVA